MDYANTLKQLREYKELKIKDIELGKSRMAYSRIENKQAKLNTQDLDSILNQMDITLEEFVILKNKNSKFTTFKKEINNYLKIETNENKKKEIISKYYNPYNITEKNKEELTIFFILTLIFKDDKNIKKIHPETINTIFNRLIKQPYYSEFDYRISAHIVNLISEKQLDKLANRIFPVMYKENRNKDTIKSANNFIINLSSLLIYNQNYKKSLYYLELLEKDILIQDNYYTHLDITFHKNLALYLLTKDTIYIEKIRHLIRLIEDLNDKVLAKTYEKELNNLTKDPTHYSNNKNIEITPYRE